MQKLQKYLIFALVFATLMAVLVALIACTPEHSEGEQGNTTETADNNVTTQAESQTEPVLMPTVERVPDNRGLSAADYSVLNIVGTDDFGRVIVPVDGKVNADRYVGMFFFLTLGQHANHTGIYDINKIT